MGRWWRAYEEAATDPKLQLLPAELFRTWFNLMCIASKHEGKLPALAHVAYTLQLKQEKAAQVLTQLCAAGLLDKTDTGFQPHNWDGRQYKQDKTDNTNADRQQRYRNRKRNAESNAVTDVTAKRPEADTETDSVASATGADAPDPRKRLFNEGLAKLASLTGKGPDACRSFVGKCLRAAGDDAVIVLGLIEDAERNQVVDPSAWIAARLKGPDSGKPKSAIIQAADDLCRTIAGFDGPTRSGDDLRGIPREASARLLSHGGSQ